jgi:hypothetical protein
VPTTPERLRPAFARFTGGPTLLREAVSGLNPADLNRRPPGSEWSIRDVILHLADAELVAAVQFRLVIAEEDAALPGFDQEMWKRRLHYLWRDPEFAISLFQQVRYASGELLQQCDNAAWARTCVHPGLGETTLAGLLEYHAAHAEEHAAQIGTMR